MPIVTGIPAGVALQSGGAVDPLAVALGYKNWNGWPGLFGNTPNSLTSQWIQGQAIWLPPGTVVTGIVLRVNQVGVGTAPTGFFVGLASPAKMLAQSGNLNNSTQLTASAGPAQLALSATYTANSTDSSTGLYYVVFLQNGAFGTTNVTFFRQSGVSGVDAPLSGQKPALALLDTGQTALAANGTAISLTTLLDNSWHVAVY